MEGWSLPREGGCRCGQVRIRVSAPPLLTMACHCTGCQRMTGSAYSLSAMLPSTGFSVIQGEPVLGGLHGATRHHFCGDCMSWIFTRPEGIDTVVNLRTTMLDDPGGLAPFMETMTGEKLPWVTTPAVHSFEGFPPLDAYAGLVEAYAAWAGADRRVAEGGEGTDREPVTLEAATRDAAPLLSHLLELYVHDMSEHFPVEIGADGLFGYDRLPLYWTEPERRFAFLFRAGTRPAGFALVTRGSPATDDPEDLDVAEFFVLRGRRRAGVGRQAAFLLWDRLPGSWVVRVSEANRAGLPFWRGVVREYTRGSFSEGARPGSPHGWRVFSFRSRAPGSSDRSG